MLLLSFLSLGASFYLYARTESALVQEMEENISELSNAISVSVEELTSPERTTEKRLQDYVKRLETRGVKEISIVSNEKEVIASSNPHRVGAKLDSKRKDLLITAKLGDQLPSPTQKAYNLLVPIVVEGEQLGYAHISMVFDDYEKLIESHYLNRLAATLIVFTLGIIVSIFLSSRYTRPIYQIMAAAKKVASGDLSQTIPSHKGNDEINELTESFNEMVVKLRQNKALEERLRETEHFTALGQLASGIAHEIRNPLNFISLSIDHLKEKAGRASPDEQKRMSDLMSSIKSEIFRLNNMVEDILKYGRPIKLQIEWMNLNLLLKEVINLANQKAIEQGVEIEYVPVDIPLIEGDGERIKTCLMNIVANGIQAMPTGGKLVIRAFRLNLDVVLEIIDNGPGISPDDLKKVFQPYFTTKQLGIGLGLALTKRIIEEHHGKIEISSIERGSGFASSSEGSGGFESPANRPLNIIAGTGTKVVLTLPVRYEAPLFSDGVQNGLSASDAVKEK